VNKGEGGDAREQQAGQTHVGEGNVLKNGWTKTLCEQANKQRVEGLTAQGSYFSPTSTLGVPGDGNNTETNHERNHYRRPNHMSREVLGKEQRVTAFMAQAHIAN
jgi:hypothetical protein